jgi:hypothetical protein
MFEEANNIFSLDVVLLRPLGALLKVQRIKFIIQMLFILFL